jgi:EAL and modified HD-GYP domain-containing signal transduction protein
VTAYELLYRDSGNLEEAQFVDGSRATCRLMSDAITVFGLPKLTNGRPAYINFTDSLLLNDFVRLAKPDEVIVEILEDTQVSELLVEKIKYLRRQGYRFALDDYVGDPRCAPLLPLIDVVKVDFRLTTPEKQGEIVRSLKKYKRITLLAEKVETEEEVNRAISLGFQRLQGYFFAKPTTLKAEHGSVVASSYMRLLAELNRPSGVDFSVCAKVIHADASLTYRLLRRVQKLAYYRGNMITAIQHALVMMGADELRRWTLLSLARDNNATKSEETVRQAYLRGAFAKRLMRCGPEKDDEEHGFLLGMFSLLDQILNVDMETLLKEIELPSEISQALLGEAEDSYYSRLLQYIRIYEDHSDTKPLPDIGLTVNGREVARLYMDSLVETDEAFGVTEGSV